MPSTTASPSWHGPSACSFKKKVCKDWLKESSFQEMNWNVQNPLIPDQNQNYELEEENSEGRDTQ